MVVSLLVDYTSVSFLSFSVIFIYITSILWNCDLFCRVTAPFGNVVCVYVTASMAREYRSHKLLKKSGLSYNVVSEVKR
jgi:hypothetical protein